MAEPFGYTIFCDDIRQEVGNKVSYMGRYLTDVVVQGVPAGTPPVALPKLCAAVMLVIPADLRVSRFRIALLEEFNGETKPLAEFVQDHPEIPLPEGDHSGEVIYVGANFAVGPFPLRDGAMIRARGYLDDREVKAGSLRVVVTTPP